MGQSPLAFSSSAPGGSGSGETPPKDSAAGDGSQPNWKPRPTRRAPLSKGHLPAGAALEGVGEELRLAVEVVGVELLDGESCLLDRLGDPPGEVAPAGEPLVERFEA